MQWAVESPDCSATTRPPKVIEQVTCPSPVTTTWSRSVSAEAVNVRWKGSARSLVEGLAAVVDDLGVPAHQGDQIADRHELSAEDRTSQQCRRHPVRLDLVHRESTVGEQVHPGGRAAAGPVAAEDQREGDPAGPTQIGLHPRASRLEASPCCSPSRSTNPKNDPAALGDRQSTGSRSLAAGAEVEFVGVSSRGDEVTIDVGPTAGSARPRREPSRAGERHPRWAGRRTGGGTRG